MQNALESAEDGTNSKIFTNTFEGVVQPSKETLKNVVALEKLWCRWS